MFFSIADAPDAELFADDAFEQALLEGDEIDNFNPTAASDDEEDTADSM